MLLIYQRTILIHFYSSQPRVELMILFRFYQLLEIILFTCTVSENRN